MEDQIFILVAVVLFGISYYYMFMNKSKVTRDDVLKRMAQNEQMEHKVIENFQKEVGERMIEEQNKANKTTKGRRVPKSRQQGQ